MKKVFSIFAIAALIIACNSADKKASSDENKPMNDSILAARNANAMADTSNFTTVEWLDSGFHDMGTVKEGQIVEVSFEFKNTGKKPLIISNVSASCGCTVPEKPEQAFAPGEKGVIRAKFDSHGKRGMNQKTVYVTANTTPSKDHQLNFKVDVTE